MIRKIVLLICLLVAVGVQAQQAKSPSFPQSFTGHWKGTLTWTVPGKAPQTFTMRLNVQPADSGRYTWQIIYGDDQKDNRPYELIPVDTAKGHWQVDEKNGIVLDSWWVANRLTGVFSVQGSTIVDQYWLEADGLHVEFISYGTKPLRTTGGTEPGIPPVEVYTVKSVQRGVLKKTD
jgi:hypothetical protein